jgi:hypothetical protein
LDWRDARAWFGLADLERLDALPPPMRESKVGRLLATRCNHANLRWTSTEAVAVARTLQGLSVATAQDGTWLSYGGAARLLLAIILAVAAAGIAYAAMRLPLPIGPASRSKTGRRASVLIWLLSLVVLVVCLAIAVKHEVDQHLFQTAPTDPITPMTLIAAGLTFFTVLIAGSGYGGRIAFVSAVVGAMAAPMIFELPFDLIVMTRTYPPVPPDPVAWRVLFFAPLFFTEITTLALLTLSPMVKLSRVALLSLATMLGIFAIWGLSGFGYPSSALPITLNVASKLVAFVAALSLFWPQRAFETAASTRAADPPVREPRQQE